ncbi:MAG TPA: tRNA lysidine(34) synthetase TilS [Xanthobacteraceae bacterium]|nr:tRNA lysidine(34) synthetase TilS [Xanthobacteraceae bacterium]
MSAADFAALSIAETELLFAELKSVPAIILAVSGGPDSTALLALAARWRAATEAGPKLIAVTIDHGLRLEGAREADGVKSLATQLGIRHRTLRWAGEKPVTGVQEAAREVRYGLLCAAARGAGATHLLTAHTLDDQAETVLIRMARGSGLTGLGAMMRETALDGVTLLRPLIDVPKARLVATLSELGLCHVDDPSNRDPRFTRARLRALMPSLAGEGLDAARLALLARRLRRADCALDAAVDSAATAVAALPWHDQGPIALRAEEFVRLPDEIALRLLGRAISHVGNEGPVQLAKLEALYQALREAESAKNARLRRTLAGALVTLSRDRLLVEQAPPRAETRNRCP